MMFQFFSPLVKDPKYAMYNLNETDKHVSGAAILKKAPFKPDAIVIYWVSGFINSKTINELASLSDATILIIMTDNAPLTGGCHYPWSCTNYQRDCTNCPGILTPSKKNLPAKNLAYKKKYIPQNVVLVPGSKSDDQRALQSSLYQGKRIHKLVAPIDPVKFFPEDKRVVKKHFGVPANQKIIFFGAHSLNDARKGGKYFVEALGILQQKLKQSGRDIDFVLMLAGHGNFEAIKNVGISVCEVGYLNEENLIKAYQAANIIASPSVEDAGPMMVNQAIMCGTPVVSFNTGVAMDLIVTGKTGYLAKLADAEDFANGLFFLLMMNDEEEQKINADCRNFALETITPEFFAKNILALMEKN